MNDRPDSGQEDRWGLCASCRHARVVTNDRGSQFVMCERSRIDDRFARYPVVPVAACWGFASKYVNVP